MALPTETSQVNKGPRCCVRVVCGSMPGQDTPLGGNPAFLGAPRDFLKCAPPPCPALGVSTPLLVYSGLQSHAVGEKGKGRLGSPGFAPLLCPLLAGTTGKVTCTCT